MIDRASESSQHIIRTFWDYGISDQRARSTDNKIFARRKTKAPKWRYPTGPNGALVALLDASPMPPIAQLLDEIICSFLQDKIFVFLPNIDGC